MATYNIVDEGADPNGNTPINSTLDSLTASGNTIIFPAGDYLLNSIYTVGSGVSNLTLQGEPGAKLIPEDHGGADAPAWIRVEGSDFGMHQFGLMVNGRNPGPVDVEADDWEMTRLITRGPVHCETDGDTPGGSGPARTWFSTEVVSPGATGLLEDCYFQDGSNQNVAAGSNRRAVLADGGEGDLTINRCWFERWGENTIYAKQPAGSVEVLNTLWKNTNNGVRTGGNTLVRNCVSIQDAICPKNWIGGARQQGVGYEADSNPAADSYYDVYNGTNTVRDCDFYHDLRTPPGEPDAVSVAIGGPAPPEHAEIIDCRIYYNTDRSHDAIYNGDNGLNPPKSWEISNVHIDNDCPGDQYCVDVGLAPNNWGPISGTWSAENGQFSNSSYVRTRMDTGTPDAVDTTPPLPEPGTDQPMANATVVTVDNTGADEQSSYRFEAVATGTGPDAGTVHPSGQGDATISKQWTGGTPGRRARFAETTINPGIKHRFYINDGSYKEGSFTQTGNATFAIDGTTASTGPTAKRWTGSTWATIADGDVKAGSSLAAAQLKFYDADAGEWIVAVDRT